MRNFHLVALAAILVLPAAASAAAESSEKKDPERKICRPEPNSVSRIAKKICKTKAEWDLENKASLDRANLERNR